MLADQALELALQSTCVLLGCNEGTTLKIGDKEKAFGRWGLSEYLVWLSNTGEISSLDKADFFTMHGWRNSVQHQGIDPSLEQARAVVNKVSTFVEFQEMRRTHTLEKQYGSFQKFTSQVGEIDEVRDIHPIFRANPFLIEPGSTLIRGEKYLKSEVQRRIDLHLLDRNGVPLYVEIKFRSVDEGQAGRYLQDLKETREGEPFRLMWAYPDDLKANLPAAIEDKKYSRSRISNWILIRRRAAEVLNRVQGILSAPTKAPRSLMYRMEYTFPNVISACYFDADVKTERGTKHIGWRKQAIGRYFDLIRSLAACSMAQESPELTVLLIKEVLAAPYYWEIQGGFKGTERGATFRVDPRGFEHYIADRRDSSIYRPLSDVCDNLARLVNAYIEEFGKAIDDIYGEDHEVEADLLHGALLHVPDSAVEFGDKLIVKELLLHLVSRLDLQASPALRGVFHTVLNTEATNKVSSANYQNDFAKRLLEISVLKGQLACVSGVPVIRVLKHEYIRNKWSYQRIPCQNFRLIQNSRLFRSYWRGSQK